MSTFYFNGVRQSFNVPDPNSEFPGDSMEKMIAAELASAAASQRALQAAKTAFAKRVRDENRAVARMIGEAFKEEEQQ